MNNHEDGVLSNNNAPQTPSKSDTQTNTTPTAADSSASKQPRSRLTFINLVLVIVVFIVVGLLGGLLFLQQQNMSAELAVLQDRVHSNQEAANELNEQNRELISQAQTLMGASSNLKEQVDFNSDRLGKLPGAERQDWLLAEAEYLLRLANQRLQLEQDWDGAINMLSAADNVLLEAQNPGVNDVRSLIAKEIQAVRNVPTVDYVGAVHRLQALQDDITKLPWVAERILPDVSDQGKQPTRALAVEWYEKAWRYVTDELARLVRVRHRDTPLEAPLSPDQQYYLQQNMRLMLEQAQLALLRREPMLYQHSLKRVSEWLDDYIIIEDSLSKAVREAIAELAKWETNPQVPLINRSLLKLREFVEQQRRGSIEYMQPAKTDDKEGDQA